MDVPDLVRQAVGDEELRAGVTLGDEDAVVFTPSRAVVYRGEGLLSDEDVAEYGFDFERLAVSEGRRKTKFTMTYVEGERSFSVPGKRTDDVLEQLLEGTLRVAGAIDGSESVTGVFRFSEMTLAVAEGRLLKHIGEYTWDADFEAFAYEDLTRLAFEEGSVATQIVLGVGNRSERIKAPNAEAGLVRKALQKAVFSHHGVDSLEELNRRIAEDEEETEDGNVAGGFGLDSGIDPLVSEESDGDAGGERREDRSLGESQPSAASSGSQSSSSGDTGAADASAQANAGAVDDASTGQSSAGSSSDRSRSSEQSPSSDQSPPSGRSRSSDRSPSSGSSTERDGATDGERRRSPSPTDGAAAGPSGPNSDDVAEQLETLTEAVERQNERLDRQQRTIQQLVEELRQGR